MASRPRSQGFRPTTSNVVVLVIVLALTVGVWLLDNRGSGTSTASDPVPGGASSTSDAPSARATPRPSASSSPSASSAPRTTTPTRQPTRVTVDPDSGLTYVDLADLPPEASDTVDLIDQGPPYPYSKDGSVFGNFEGILPDRERGYYEEFTVVTPGSGDRGARRIVAGLEDELYWTEDHYDSFERIRR